MMISNTPQFRPPAEVNSLILQIDVGCPHNTCTFCGMYRQVKYQRRTLPEIEEIIHVEAKRYPNARRIFLADGDPLVRPFDELFSILVLLSESFLRLARVNAYANGSSMLKIAADQWLELKKHKLHTLYMGLESGDEKTLKDVVKGESVHAMTQACRLVQESGVRLSVMVLLGLAGESGSRQHIEQTAIALNEMQPRLLSCLRTIPVPGTGFMKDVKAGRIQQISEYEVVQELQRLLEQLDLKQTIFRANHASNVLPLEGRLPKDQQRLIAECEHLLTSRRLDRHSPGPMPLWL